MKFPLQLIVEVGDRETPQKAIKIILDRLANLPKLKVRVADMAMDSAADAPSALSEKIEDYGTRLEYLSKTLELVANDHGAASPYGTVLTQIKRKKGPLSISDQSTLSHLKKFTDRAPLLARIKRFLVELPNAPEFDKLRLLQKLVQKNLPFPKVLENPELIDAVALQSFEEYRAEYELIYLAQLATREQSIATWRRSLPLITHQLEVITALDTITVLGIPRGKPLAIKVKRLTAANQLLNLPRSELKKILTLEPIVNGISLFAADPATELQATAAQITATLETKLTIIAEKSVSQILATSRDPSIRKLTKLLSLTQLEKITKLFTKKTTPKIIHELQKLLDEKNLTTIALGDFSPRLKVVKDSATAKKLAAELEKFITSKLAKQPKNTTLILT